MSRRIVASLILVLITSPALAWGAQAIVDEQVVFRYSSAVEAGNPAAVKAVFALSTDGAAAEAQDIVLGKLISKHPRLFLKELQQSQFANCKACLAGLLGNFGPDFVDRPAAQERALKKRRYALSGVRVKSLAKLRNACIAELNRQIDQMQSILGIGGVSSL